MKLMNSLALRHLKQNKRQTLSAFFAIALSVSMLVAVSTFCFSVYQSFAEFAKANKLEDIMNSSLQSATALGGFLGVIIAAAAIIVISNAFNIQASERMKQFGILKSVGATEKQIHATVTAESNWLSLIGIPAGIVLGHVLCFIAVSILRNFSEQDSGAVYTVHFNLLAILLASALGYVSVRLASALTAQKVSKVPPIEAIRQTDEINLKGNKLKTSKITGKLFGFAGTLAAKQLKRHRRKFRVTILSLVTSIILTLVAFSFGDTLIKTAIGAYASTGANVVSEIMGSSADFPAFDDYAKMVKSQNIQEMHTLYSYNYYGEEWYSIVSMDDGDYNAFCRQAGVRQGSYILLNRKDKTVPFDVTLADLGNIRFSVTDKTDFTNRYLKELTMTSYPTILMSRSEIQRLGLPIEAHYFIAAENAADLISKIQPTNEAFDSYYIHNTEEYTRSLQRMYAMMMMFIYCFIGMLTLIGATGVLSTVNSNINLRLYEFATLQAVGMETRQLHKMLNIESILYGLKSLLYGLPIGLILSYFAYELAVNDTFYLNVGRLSAEDTAAFSFAFPYQAILVCVIGVFGINFLSMYFATSKIRRSNIAETMRELNC